MTNIKDEAIQGEGDYKAARRYRKNVEKFVATHDVNKAAHDAAPKSPEEARELREAENRGRSKSRDNHKE